MPGRIRRSTLLSPAIGLPVTGPASFYGYYSTGGGNVRYVWATSDGQTATTSTAQFQFNAPGRYTIALTVTDSTQKQDTASIAINVRAANNGISIGMPTGGDPVVLSTGNYIQSHTDLKMPGKGFPFEFTRFYNSKFSDQSGVPFGFGWTFNFNDRLVITATNVLVIEGDGSAWTFSLSNGAYVGEAGVWDSLAQNADGTWSLRNKRQNVRLFSSSGRLLSLSDKNDNTLVCSYDDFGVLSSILDTAGRTLLFSKNAIGCISTITDLIGRTINFQYDSETNLVAVVDANSQTSRFFYDANHQLTNGWDAKGTSYIYNEYDPISFVVLRQRDAFTNWTCFAYDLTNRITWQTNSLNRVSIHYFDEQLLETNVVDEVSNQQSFAYDTHRNRVYIRDKNGNETRYGYDSLGNVTHKTDALGNVTSIEYDLLNNPTHRIDAIGNATFFGYDSRGNLTSTTNALGFVSHVEYDISGLPILLTDARGFRTINSFDIQGNLIAVVDAKGFARRWAYDLVGRKIREIDALDHTNSFVFDNNDNLLFTTNALGFVNAFAYDANNNRIISRNPRAATFTNIFDLLPSR